MKRFSLISTLLFAFAVPVSASPWTGNYKDALESAATDQKDILIYFSGSAWDQWTKKLEEKILSTDEFKQAAPKQFVMMNYDLPSNARKDPASAHKVKMADQFGVRRLPAMVLADSKGRPYGSIGFKDVSPAEFLKQLNDLKAKGAEFQKSLKDAAGKKGEDKAKALIAALEQIPKTSWKEHYQAELDAIKAADPEGKTGFIAKLEKEEAVNAERLVYQELFKNKKLDEVIKKSSAAIEKAKGEDAQRFYMYKIQALAAQKKYKAAKEAVATMAKIDPKSTHGSSLDRYNTIIDQMQSRDERVAKAREEAKKNPPKKQVKPTGPIVSKPVAVVSDVKVLHEEAKKIEAELQKAAKQKDAKVAAQKKSADRMAALEKELAALKKSEAKTAEEAKKAAEAHAKVAKKFETMKDVIKTHESMESRKNKAKELEKKASELEKEAAKLKEKASEIKKGK